MSSARNADAKRQNTKTEPRVELGVVQANRVTCVLAGDSATASTDGSVAGCLLVPVLGQRMSSKEVNSGVAPGAKEEYGEVRTPAGLVRETLSLVPTSSLKSSHLRCLDMGAGTGAFTSELLSRVPPDARVTAVEIQRHHCEFLQREYGNRVDVIGADFTDFMPDERYNLIVGNPPFNAFGRRKVPTGDGDKKRDGRCIWPAFVAKALQLLEHNGILCCIIPALWLKPDKAGMYDALTSYDLIAIKAYNASQACKLFDGNAQTPITLVCLRKNEPRACVRIMGEPDCDWPLCSGRPIPMCMCLDILKMSPLLDTYGHLSMVKTNLPKKGVTVSPEKDDVHRWPGIKTCVVQNGVPTLVVDYANKPLAFSGQPKVVLAHKMHGYPYLDAEGSYGVSNRDCYVFASHDVNALERVHKFLSSSTVMRLYDATRYRMRYLEKYIFELLPDISNPHVWDMLKNTLRPPFKTAAVQKLTD